MRLRTGSSVLIAFRLLLLRRYFLPRDAQRIVRPLQIPSHAGMYRVAEPTFTQPMTHDNRRQGGFYWRQRSQ